MFKRLKRFINPIEEEPVDQPVQVQAYNSTIGGRYTSPRPVLGGSGKVSYTTMGNTVSYTASGSGGGTTGGGAVLGGVVQYRDLYPEQSIWPNICNICKSGCVRLLCKDCEVLFKRGLKKSTVEDEYISQLFEGEIRLKIREYRIKMGREPEYAIFHPESINDVKSLPGLAMMLGVPNPTHIYNIRLLVDPSVPRNVMVFR